jgi:hypothetical protein
VPALNRYLPTVENSEHQLEIVWNGAARPQW